MFKHILSSRACRILEVDAEMAVRGQLAHPPNSQIEAQRRYVMWQDQRLNLGLLTQVSAPSIMPFGIVRSSLHLGIGWGGS